MILAIIALIAVPIILNIIDDTKRSTRMRSVELYLDTAGKSVVAYQVKNPDKKIEESCEVQANGNLKCDGIEEEIKVEVKGQTGKSGTIVFQEGKIIKVIKLVIGDYEYNMDESGKITEKEYVEQILEETPLRCFDYEEKEDGTVAIIGYKCGGYYEAEYLGSGIYLLGTYHEAEVIDVVIPSKINDKVVNEIASEAFRVDRDCNNDCGGGCCVISPGEINSVIIPDSVTSIGDWAFNDNKLTNIIIPDSVISIGSNAFSGNQLTSVTIGSSVTSIGVQAFSWNQLTSVTIPESVTSIEFEAFFENQLTSVTIGNSVTSIGEGAFQGNELTSVTIPDSVTSIGGRAFYENQLTSVEIPNNVTSIGDWAFNDNQLPEDQAYIYKRNNDGSIDNTTLVSYGGKIRENLIIPNNIITIGNRAFYGNGLTSVTIPESVTSIGNSAFGLNQLTSVVIKAPKSQVTLGSSVFGWAEGYGDSNIQWASE